MLTQLIDGVESSGMMMGGSVYFLFYPRQNKILQPPDDSGSFQQSLND